MDRSGGDDSGVFGAESIAVDPRDPNTVSAAGGFYDVNVSAEVLVSHSRGAFWSDTGLAVQPIHAGP